MLEELKKSIDKGLDYAFMTGEKLAQAAKDMAKENKLTKEEAKKLLDHLKAKSDETRKNIENELQEAIRNTLKKMNVATLEDLKKMDARIKKLESAKKPPAKPKAKPAGAPVAKVKK
jgi:polyhydroxyalkanoate synthesis regulator phasin